MSYFFKGILGLGIVFLLSCSSKKVENNKPINFPDSLFVFNDLRSLTERFHFEYKREGRIIQSFFKGKPVIRLDSAQKVILLKPFSQHLTMYQDQPWMYDAQFLSKQVKIGKLQPIILSVGGTDYTMIWYIVLDENNVPVSCIILDGENCESFGEDFELTKRDSAVTLCAKKKNYFKENTIESQKLTITRLYEKEFEIVDSVSYITTIKQDGSLSTEKLDSIRLRRKARYFNRYRSD